MDYSQNYMDAAMHELCNIDVFNFFDNNIQFSDILETICRCKNIFILNHRESVLDDQCHGPIDPSEILAKIQKTRKRMNHRISKTLCESLVQISQHNQHSQNRQQFELNCEYFDCLLLNLTMIAKTIPDTTIEFSTLDDQNISSLSNTTAFNLKFTFITSNMFSRHLLHNLLVDSNCYILNKELTDQFLQTNLKSQSNLFNLLMSIFLFQEDVKIQWDKELQVVLKIRFLENRIRLGPSVDLSRCITTPNDQYISKDTNLSTNESEQRSKSEPSLNDISKLKILVVDDIEINQKILCLHLKKRFKFDIDLALDGQEGLTKYLNKLHDIIFLDLDLPKLSGNECAKYMRMLDKSLHKTRTTTVLAITANHSFNQNSLDSQYFDHIFYKPFRMAQIIEFIDHHLILV